MESPETTESRDKLYHKKMSERQAQFMEELIDPLEVVSKLQAQNVFPRGRVNAVASKLFRQQQKMALFQILADMPFVSIDCITEALRLTGNLSLSGLMKLLKFQIGQEYPFNNEIITRPPSRVAHDSMGPGDDDDPRNRGDDGSVSILLVPVNGDPDAELNVAAIHGNVELLEQLLLSRESLEFEESKSTAIHKAVSGKNSQDAIKCIRLIVARYVEILEKQKVSKDEIEAQKFSLVNHKDEEGNTAMHLAAENESVEIVRTLFDDYQADLFIENDVGFCPLEIMYLKTPQAIVHLLNGTLTTQSHPSDGNLELEIDLGPLIRKPPNSRKDGSSTQMAYTETDLLANLVHESKAATKTILPHVIVRTFLDLKWESMKIWLYSSMVLQIALHLWYTLFVIQVFLVDCPHLGTSKQKTSGSSENHTLNDNGGRTFFGYLFGEWGPVENTDIQKCSLSPWPSVQAVLLFIIGIVFIVKELDELWLVTRRGGYRKQKQQGKLQYYWNGLKTYFCSIENVFQFIFSMMMIFVTTLVFCEEVTVYKVSIAGFSVVIAWGLILMQVGNVVGLGIYIQMLGKALKIFGILMGTYIGLIIAFSISFSIIFPSVEPFKTLPKSLSRVVVMMTGELSYDETLYGNGDEDPRPPIPLAAQIIFISFTLLLPIVLTNLLIALIVSDVKILWDKSEVLLRSIQVERLYVMETFLIRASWATRKCNIFVVDPSTIAKNGMVVKKSIKDIKDVQLQRELRSMARNAEEYGEEYMKKYAS